MTDPARTARGRLRSAGRLVLVGFGPGHADHLTPAARRAIAEADLVVGYRTYIEIVRPLLDGKTVIATGMTEEIDRARAAVEAARAGRQVAVVSSGDPGIYGMAGLVFEVLRETGWRRGAADDIQVEVVPGITALSSCASLLGAPLVHDFAAISLSDLLTPWPVIRRRLEAAAAADFVIALYNPKSGRRTRQIVEAQAILRAHRAGSTPVGLVKSAYRELESVVLTDLDHCLDYEIGMLTTVLVGNSQTEVFEGLMVTPRGYANKYTWDGAVRPGQRPARSLVVAGDAGGLAGTACTTAEAPPAGALEGPPASSAAGGEGTEAARAPADASAPACAGSGPVAAQEARGSGRTARNEGREALRLEPEAGVPPAEG